MRLAALLKAVSTPASNDRLKRKFRLTKTTDFQRVRQQGKSFAHPLIVLLLLPNELTQTRIAVSASRTVGNAVQRNRIKRRLREIVRHLYIRITPGYDLIILARRRASAATIADLHSALLLILQQARLIEA